MRSDNVLAFWAHSVHILTSCWPGLNNAAYLDDMTKKKFGQASDTDKNFKRDDTVKCLSDT